MSNEELYHARLDRLLDAITNKELLIESLQKKITKQVTIEELREQFEEWYITQPDHYKEQLIINYKSIDGYSLEYVQGRWLSFKAGYNLIKEKL